MRQETLNTVWVDVRADVEITVNITGSPVVVHHVARYDYEAMIDLLIPFGFSDEEIRDAMKAMSFQQTPNYKEK
jgi:hypothetical protein